MAEDLKKLVERGVSKGYSLEKIQSDFANAGWGEAYLNNIPVYYNEFKKKSPVGARDAGVLPSRQGDTRFSSESQLQQDKYAGVGNIPLSDPLLKKKDGLADSLFKIINQAEKDADNANKYVPQIEKLWNDYSSIERGQKETQNIFDERGRINRLALSSLNASAKRNSDRVKEEAKAIAKDDGVLETAARGFYGGILGAADYVANLFDPDTYDDQPDAPDSLGLEAKRQLERAQKASLGRKLSAGYTEKQIEDGFIGNFTNGNYGAAFDLFGRDLVEVLPQNAVGFIPYVGLPLMAASAGGGGWQSVKDDDKYSTLEKFLYAPLVGAAEYATEKFFGMDRRMVQKGLSEAFGKTIKSGADIPKKELGDMLFGGIPKAVRAPLEEGLEEGIVSTFTQTLDKIMADKPFDPVEIAESVMLGAGAGGSTYALVRGGSALLQTPVFNDVYTITNNVNKINELLKSEDIVPEEKEILSNRLNQFKTQLNQLRNEASDYYKPFSKEDKQRTLELNQAITKGMRTYGAMKTPEAKAEVVNTIRQSLAEKAQIEQKYDSTQKQQVPSPVVQGTQPGGVPIQGTSAEAPQAGGVLQVPSQQEEEIASKTKVIENSSPAFSFKPVSVTLTENNAPEVIGNITTYVDTIPDELFKTLSTSRQEVMNGVESISNVISSLSKSGRQVPVTVYATEDAWKRGTGQPLSRGIYVESEVEGQPSSISVFLPALVGNTVYHEGLHDVVPKVFGTKGIETVAKRLSQAVKQDPLLAAQLGQFVSNYEQSDKAEEFLAELGSRVSAGDIDIEVTKSLATRFMEAVASVLGAVGIKMSPNASQLSRAFLEYAQKLGAGVELGEIGTEREGETGVRRQALGLRRKEESLIEFGLPTNKRPNNREVGQALELRQRKKYKKIKPNDFSDKSADIISDYMVDEIIFEVESLGKNSAVGWYGPRFQEALDELARVMPSMRNQSDRNLFTMLVAITSDGQKVENNFTYALSLYNSYVKDGVVSQEFSFGADRNTSMKSNVQEINRLLKQSNDDLTNINDILLEKMRYGDIKKKYGVKDDFTETDTKKANKSDYKVDMMMPVSAGIFGPKLGAFYANLSGQEEYLTMDRWWNRTFNRYRGTLLPTVSEKGLERFKSLVGLPPTARKSTTLKEVTKYANAYKKKKFKDGTEIEKAANTIYKAAFTELNDSPSGAGEREFMIKTANKAKDKLSKAGYDLTVADVQAVLWYFEKRLYAEIKNTKFAMDIDYSDAMRKIVSNSEKLKILPNQIGKGKVESEQEMVDIIDSPTNNLIQLDEVVDLEAVNNATETINKAQERPSPRKVMRMALEGYNEKPQAMAGQRLFNEPLKEAADIADKYYEKEFNEARPKFNGVKSVDKERAKRISDAYIEMEDNYFDPEVKKAYDAMIDETLKQFDFIVDRGYKVVINNEEPYKNSEDMITDLRDNKVMRIFSTESGFGDEPITENQRDSNPLLKDSGRKDANGIPLLNNDLFRFVHDFFGHAELGNGFGAVGEENAWNVHARMYSPLARRAMTSETRGQNSYVNFSGVNEEAFKLRDKAREERKKGNDAEADKLLGEVYEKMKFADQKVGLLPEEMTIPDEFQDTKPKPKVLGVDTPMTQEDQKVVDFVQENEDYDTTSDLKKTKAQRIPEKTQIAYKLFRVKRNQPGKLFPLYVKAKDEVPIGEWVDAVPGEYTVDKNGRKRVKSRIGNLAYRPGWHSGDSPASHHIGKRKQGESAPSFRDSFQVWAEVEVGADKDWQVEADARAKYGKDGKKIDNTADLDYMPEGGFYKYKTNPNMTGKWLISGEMKVNRILTDEEVSRLNEEFGIADLPRVKPMDWKKFGFEIDGDEVKPKSKVKRMAITPSESRETPSQIDARAGELLLDLFKGTKYFDRVKSIKRQLIIDPESRKKYEKALGEKDGRALYGILGNQDAEKAIAFAKEKFPIKGSLAAMADRLYKNDEYEIVNFGSTVIYGEYQKYLNKELKDIVNESTLDPKDLLKEVGYELFNPKNLTEARESFLHFYENGKNICTLNIDSVRFRDYFVTFIVKDDAAITPMADRLTQDNLTKDWKDYLEKKGRKNADGTYNLERLERSSLDPYSTSVVSLQINKSNGDVKEISRYNHQIGSPDNIFNRDFNKIIDGLEDAMFKKFSINKNINQSRKKIPYGIIQDNDGRFFNYIFEQNGVYYGDGFYLENGVATILDKNSQRMVDGFVINANGKVENVTRTQPFLYGDVLKVNYIKGNEISLTTRNGDFVFEVKNGAVVKLINFPKEWRERELEDIADYRYDSKGNIIIGKINYPLNFQKYMNMLWADDIVGFDGSVDFNGSKIQSLGEVRYITESVYLRDSQIQSLGKLMYIGGSAYLAESKVESLGELRYITYLIELAISQVKSLGKLRYIGGSVELMNTQVQSLGELRYAGSADFRYSQLQSLGKLRYIKGNLYSGGAQSLGELRFVGGRAELGGIQDKSLGELRYIGRDVEFVSNNQVQSPGELRYLGKEYYLSKIWDTNTRTFKFPIDKSLEQQLSNIFKLSTSELGDEYENEFNKEKGKYYELSKKVENLIKESSPSSEIEKVILEIDEFGDTKPNVKLQKIAKAQGSQLEAQMYGYLLSISQKQPDNTYKLPFTLNDFLSFMSPTFSRQRATQIYQNVSNGVIPQNVVKSVPSIDDAYDASKKLLDSQKNKKIFTWDAARKFFLDRQATLKAAILKAGMKNAYNLLVNRAGSGARANYFFSKQEKAIYDGLSSKDIEALDKIIMLRRIAEIDKNFDVRGEKRPIHPNKLNFESAQIGLAEKRKELGDAKFNELNDRANQYFDAFKSLLDSMYDEGLINEDLYNRLKNLDYQPRMFIEHVFDMDELSMRDINLSANQVKRIKDGSEDEIMFDSRFLLAVYSKSTFSRIARNKVNRAIAEATSVKGNEEWISKDPKKQFSEVTYFEDGVRKQFYIKSSLKGELDDVQRFGAIPPESQKYVGLLSGSYLLKLLATRANPLFVFRNIPRDYLHVLFFTNVYDNMNMPLAMYRLAGDAIKGVKGKIKDDQDYKDFIEYGGGMEYLSTEGKEGMMTNRSLLNRTIEKLGSAGELSEIAFRLGMYKRLVQESLKNFNGTPTEEQLAQIKVEAVTKSREMIDFAQGGVATKTLESAVPYINAAFQGFRVSSAYIKNNPKEFVIKLGQLAIGLAVIAMYNAVMGDDDMEDIPEDVKRKYFIIMTPFTEEKDGKTVRKYIKIAKTQQLIPFISSLDMSLEGNLIAPFMGREPRFNEDTIKQSWDAFLSYFPKDPTKPLDEALSSVPLFSALAAYKMNYDTYRKRIVSTDYQDKNVLPAYEDFTDKNVPYFYKAIGQAVEGGAGPKRLQVATEKFITTPYSSLITMGGYTLMDAIASNVYEVKGPGGYTPAEQEAISNKALKSAGINVEKIFIGTTDPDHKIYNKREQIERINLEASTERRGLKLQAKELGGKYFTAREQGDTKGMNEALEAIRNARIEVRDKAVKDKNKQDYDYFSDALKTNMRFGPTFPQEYNDITFATDNEARAKIIAIRDMNMTEKELIDYLVDYKRKTGKSIDIRTIIREYDKFVTDEKK